jgi:hypothetical protein
MCGTLNLGSDTLVHSCDQGGDVAGVEFGEALSEPFVAVSGEQPAGQVRQLVPGPVARTSRTAP